MQKARSPFSRRPRRNISESKSSVLAVLLHSCFRHGQSCILRQTTGVKTRVIFPCIRHGLDIEQCFFFILQNWGFTRKPMHKIGNRLQKSGKKIGKVEGKAGIHPEKCTKVGENSRTAVHKSGAHSRKSGDFPRKKQGNKKQ